MRVSFLPRQGGWHVDPKRPGHYLRVSGHPDAGIVVVSIWRGERCIATHEVPSDDVPDLVGLLTRALLPAEPAVEESAS